LVYHPKRHDNQICLPTLLEHYAPMSRFPIQFIAGTSLLVASCSQPKPDIARLSQADVFRLAGVAAVEQGYSLEKYKDPQAHYEFTRNDRTWGVFYDGKVPAPGNHFLVVINDRTGTARVMPGE